MVFTRRCLIVGLMLLGVPLLANAGPAGLSSAVVVQASDVRGHWSGNIKLPGMDLGVQVHLISGVAGWTGTISIPQQGAKDLPLENVEIDGERVAFAIAGVPGSPTFNGKVSDDGGEISGDFTQGQLKATFTLRKAADPAEATAKSLDGFGEWLEGARAAWKAPGVAVAIVKDDAVVFIGGAGFRDMESKLPMTPDTLLAIGSTTKAFTTAVMGTLAEEGKLDWDAPARRAVPEFAIADEVAAARITPTDLVTHRSGMPRHDLLWYNSSLSRREMFERMRYLESNKGLRQEFQYNNLMYLAAGVMIERLTGGTWEDAVRSRIFAPLGMTRSVFGPVDAQRDADCAVAYREDEDVVKRVNHRDIREVGPAGSIYSSVREMSNWVRAQMGGRVEGHEVLSGSMLEKMHSPHMHIGGPAAPAEQETVMVGYGLGWFIDVYRGHRRVHHGGNIDGFSALVVLFPDDNAGMVVLTNMDASALPGLVARHAADRLLGLEQVDWNAKALAKRDAAKAMQKEAETKKQAVRKSGTTPAHDLAAYAGGYRHPGYGVIDIARSDAGLRFTFNRISAGMEHWHFEVFNCLKNPDEPLLEDTKVQFVTGMDGEVEALRLTMDANFEPLVFKRLPDANLTDPAHLATLAGQYMLGPETVTMDVRGSVLWATIPGQPTYELIPARNNTFDIKGLSGFRVRFDVEGSTATRVSFIQPNGVFVAERKK